MVQDLRPLEPQHRRKMDRGIPRGMRGMHGPSTSPPQPCFGGASISGAPGPGARWELRCPAPAPRLSQPCLAFAISRGSGGWPWRGNKSSLVAKWSGAARLGSAGSAAVTSGADNGAACTGAGAMSRGLRTGTGTTPAAMLREQLGYRQGLCSELRINAAPQMMLPQQDPGEASGAARGSPQSLLHFGQDQGTSLHAAHLCLGACAREDH